MGLEVTLLGIVVSIVVWVVRHENAGILNAVMEPKNVPGKGIEFDLKSNLGQGVLDFIVPMLLQKPIPLTVLEAIPESLGGGKAGVEASHAEPNREPTILWTAISLFLVVLVLIILIQIINCCCCCCGDSEKQVRFTVNCAK